MRNLNNIDLSFIEEEYFKKEIVKYLEFVLALNLKIKGILLFGSVATGNAKNEVDYLSDIDLIIICDDLPKDRGERKEKIFNLVKLVHSGIQDIWLTSKELEEQVDSKFYLILDAFDEGKILHDPDSLLKRLKDKLFNELKKKGVIKTELYWQWPIKEFGDKIEY